VVEASAGTGKTYLLEHLVVELLLNHGARMEEILVVTFTERATAELCLRLRKKLGELSHLAAEPCPTTDANYWLIDEAARGRLRDALLALDRATISTIHGFCLGILGDHAFLHQRMFDEQAVDERGAFHTAFVEALRNDFATKPELQPYLCAWLATERTPALLEHALRECAAEMARIFPPRPEALQPDFDEAALAAAIAAWPMEAALDPKLAERLKQAGIKGPTGKAVLSRIAALSELVASTANTGETAAFLTRLQAKESSWGDNRGFGYLLDHLAEAAGPGAPADTQARRRVVRLPRHVDPGGGTPGRYQCAGPTTPFHFAPPLQVRVD
jgi:exodeoxyribonuclease V beta subunit